MIFLQHQIVNTCDVCQRNEPNGESTYWEDVFAVPDPTKLNTVENAKRWIMDNGIPEHTYRIIDATVEDRGVITRRYWLIVLREVTVPTRQLEEE